MLLRYIESKKERQNILQACHCRCHIWAYGENSHTTQDQGEIYVAYGMVKDVMDPVSYCFDLPIKVHVYAIHFCR